MGDAEDTAVMPRATATIVDTTSPSTLADGADPERVMEIWVLEGAADQTNAFIEQRCNRAS